MFSCEFSEISKNTFFTEFFRTTASDFSPFIQLIWADQFFLVLRVRCMRDVFLLIGSKKAMMQFQIVLDMVRRIKTTRHASEFQGDSTIQARHFITKRLQHRCFLVIYAKF